MKKRIALLLTIVLLISQAAFAAELPDLTAYTDEELTQLRGAIDEELAARAGGEATPAAAEASSAQYESLEKGSKGDAVKALQQRLIELNYLSGSADGDFGGKTKSAVELFQKEAGLTVTGVADSATQEALFADSAPKAKVYLTIDYKAMSRDPDAYEGNLYTFTGKVLQVVEDSGSGSTTVGLRIATKGNYDDVVWVMYIRAEGESRILEDDRVTIYATSTGLFSYETVRGDTISIPSFFADTVSLS